MRVSPGPEPTRKVRPGSHRPKRRSRFLARAAGFLRYRWRCPAGRHGICSRPLFSDDHRNVPVRLCPWFHCGRPPQSAWVFTAGPLPQRLEFGLLVMGLSWMCEPPKFVHAGEPLVCGFSFPGPWRCRPASKVSAAFLLCVWPDSLISWTRLQTGRLRPPDVARSLWIADTLGAI
jgi:hypothetical protein